MNISKYEGKYKGVKLQRVLKDELLGKILKDRFYQYNMELRTAISEALDEYAKNALKLSAVVRKSRLKT